MVTSTRLDEAVQRMCDPVLVMQRIVEQATDLLPAADGAAVELLLGDTLCYVCATGTLAPFAGIRLDPAASLSGLALRQNRAERCDDSETDERVDREACRLVGSVSMVCVPLRHGADPVGVLKVSARASHAFDDADVALLGRLGRFVTTTITNARKLREVADELLAPAPGPGPALDAVVDHEAMSTFVANVVVPGVVDRVALEERLHGILGRGCLHVLLQPIVDLRSFELAGAEALARFPVEPHRTPDVWFAEARAAHQGVELQLEAAGCALAAMANVPTGAFLAVNLDGEALADEQVTSVLEAVETGRVVVELTEHVEIDDYPGLRRSLTRLRAAGARLAIDDTGAGYSSFVHILQLAPELIKLDIGIVRGVDRDPVRRSLVTAVVAFAGETGSRVVAEGIETDDELDVLRDLGVELGQGYGLARPMPPGELTAWAAGLARRVQPA